MTMHAVATADPSAEFRLVVREALISLEAASVAAEALDQGDERSRKADQASVADFVDAALAAVRRLDASAVAAPKTIFPSADMARTWCERNPLGGGLCYQIHQDGIGRCTVSINAPLEFL